MTSLSVPSCSFLVDSLAVISYNLTYDDRGRRALMIEMIIDSIRMSLMNYQRVVILKEKSSDRYLPIWIGQTEADAIAMKLQGVETPRPLTHDLLRNMVKDLGAKINYIVVNDLRDDTFYAKINLTIDSRNLEVDSRPSDAIALAVRVDVPIYAAEAVVDRAGIMLDSETGKPVPSSQSDEKAGEEELRRLSAFYDFIKTLDLDDLGQGKS
jgi:bifunctional DNase/RNase